ncbi:DUF5615 family PIN-like protein [Nocardia cyriacigeorgica]|uniref:DUF5615 family PIN-like protein n=1 Tax=Nocardia cyriacigeorgica TaxID=135487 RepID=UPI0013D5FCF5|nr:DUF5615 family PIN-like protein [Nocardia cyriacigeorgica]MBF6437122.1 DUF5615 family PIN-like protein [Nocardia cyriacigeorgica]MBF6452692.1 DUF5615 family PIN-like protein [Nocardia cyriacigeorgica]MBF6476568.1 DUF5615 family PIN-like protein [Nocardia cyriacigeorgica]MBF6549861.1 DUF5615 family PIN-like protein [Nocardia cyriacigeorgica]NEW25533.1 hypothetical protein [Nocardia cyriacigeorgica]
MRFVVDAQLPPALARALTEEGHDAVHVCDIGLLSAPDVDVWAEALERGAAIVTKDEDFILMGRSRPDAPSPAVIWIRIGNCSRKELLGRFLPILPTVVQMLGAGEKIIEVR